MEYPDEELLKSERLLGEGRPPEEVAQTAAQLKVVHLLFSLVS
jgi:hypothetical protein